MRNLLTVILAVFLALTIASGGIFVFLYNLNQPPARAANSEIIFKVEKGETLEKISSRLEEAGVIKSALMLNILSKLKGTERAFKMGTYKIDNGLTTLKIHNILVSGNQMLFQVTFPEGFTVSRIADRLEDNNIVDKESFLRASTDLELLKDLGIPGNSAEGYLFPDTYKFPQNYNAEKIVTVMVKNFYKKLEEIYPDYKMLSDEELRQKVIIASIIEREYRVKEEAPIIASVFYNRLKLGMPLSSCATVEYVITEIKGEPHPEYLTYEDLKIPSEYNTYLHSGLPPAPISNPGITAIEAVFYPKETDYLYFLLKDKTAGRHYFSENIEKHNRAKFLYLKSYSE